MGKSMLTHELRDNHTVPRDSCGITVLEARKLISFRSFRAKSPRDGRIHGLRTPRNEKAPAGTEDFFCYPIFLPSQQFNHQKVDGVTFVVS